MRRILSATLKIAVSATLLYFALRNTDFAALGARLSPSSAGWLALALALVIFQTVLLAARWRLLSGACDVPLSLAQTFRFNMIGAFFNQTLPSSIGGDAVRVWLVGRRHGWRAAAYSIFIDRAIGLIAMALLILFCLPWSLDLLGDPKARAALVIATAAALGATFGFLLLAAIPARLLTWFQPLHHLRRCATIAIGALTDRHRGPIIVALSFAIHFVSVAVASCAAAAIAAPVSFAQLLLLLLPVSLLIMLPVSIAGWGVREAALGAAFASAGMAASEGVNVSLIYGLIVFAAGGLGGIVWVVSAEKAEKGAKPMDVPAIVP